MQHEWPRPRSAIFYQSTSFFNDMRRRHSLGFPILSVLLPSFAMGWSFPWVVTKRKAIPSLKVSWIDETSNNILSRENVCLIKIPCSFTDEDLIIISNTIKRRQLFDSIQFLDASNRVYDVPFSSSKSLSIRAGSVASITTYAYSKATSMLQLQKVDSDTTLDAPRYIPITPGEEEVLVSNGWSFLDSDESEPMSAFDVDKANEEGKYIPKWFHNETLEDDDSRPLSFLGYDLNPISSQDLLSMADAILSSKLQGRSVLLHGSTDPPGRKITNNGYDFSGSVQSEDIPAGIFVCALGSLPLFATTDLKPCTTTSGWLSFSQPLSDDHITLVFPNVSSTTEKTYDNRIEVICARTGCHLGHYFGKDGGYCINASCLNFLSLQSKSRKINMTEMEDPMLSYGPASWILFRERSTSTSHRLLSSVIQDYCGTERVVLGAGCFWHIEHALRRLPGVIQTSVGFAGGFKGMNQPTYSEVSKGDTGYAEVVCVTFDPFILSPYTLFDCFFAMHDPTIVRAHGKRTQGTGQYRSCIFVDNDEIRNIAHEVLAQCQRKLGLGLSTEIIFMPDDIEWFFPAEDRHQQYEQKVKGRDPMTLTIKSWIMIYARRSTSIWGSSETIVYEDDGDDGMARIII